MKTFSFHIDLTSDAEPGTGLGGEVVNELVPRDHRRRPILPASHLKGLMRAAWREIADSLGWSTDIESAVFGSPDQSGPGKEAAVQMSDAVATTPVQTNLLTRTAVDEAGVGRDQSLRTTEAVPVGTRFTGQIHTQAASGTVEDLAWRLALLAVSAVGGNRNRGSGQCLVELAGERRSPGQILQELADLRNRSDAEPAAQESERSASPTRFESAGGALPLSGEAVVLNLVFRATTPICCPEIPDKTNVMSTGFSIPASAVQGMVLTRINREHPSLATALFSCPTFRAWPLQPCSLGELGQEQPPGQELPTAVRVSLTHRAAKFSLSHVAASQLFYDEALDGQVYDWTKVADGAPLKATDGVLLRGRDGRVQLWKHSAMPHVISSHGVHCDPETDHGRNLFTVDAMAPIVWQGLLVMPREAAEIFLAGLETNRQVALGKSRTVRGSGQLHARIIKGVPDAWRTHTEKTVLVVQSPLLLPSTRQTGQTSEDELAELAGQWAARHGLPAPAARPWAHAGVQFGWNRHRAGCQQACRVLLPGSVIAFDCRLDDSRLTEILKNHGIGEGRERGFGAVSVHPGKAVDFYEPAPHLRSLDAQSPAASQAAMNLILEVRSEARQLPSPSQIRAVQQRLLKAGQQPALDYVKQQTQRTTRIWFVWETIYTKIEQLIRLHDTEIAVQALETLADLAIMDQQKGART